LTPLIHILDAHSANQISAGEVVERPASVVKELVENSLDAGAKRIDITIEGNGVPLIQVRDDGSGIGIADLPLAVIRHATSKISQIEDLDHLKTLGFRGEALPSIASVSYLEISSRPANEAAGISYTLDGGEQGEFKEIGCPVGTSVTVRNLFFNTPARLKFLKSTPTEFGLISDTVGRMALAHPDVAFSLAHPHQVVLQTSGRGDLREAIAAVLGHAIARQLIPINVLHENWRLEGFISPPNLVRSSKQAQFFMLNGRIIRSPLLSRAIADGYHTLIPAKLHPIVVLHLTVPPTEYDVNVHPTKMDVRFKEEHALTLFIREAVHNTLINSKPLPSILTKVTLSPPPKAPNTSISVPNSETPSRPTNKTTELIIQESEAPKTYSQPQINFKPETTKQPKLLESILEHQLKPLDSIATIKPKAEEILEHPENSQDLDPLQADQPLNHIWPLTQLFNTYILATDGNVLFMIDQHAAHERINYERILREFRQAELASQTLLIPLAMEFTLQEEQALLENLWILNEMGFILEQFGSRTYLLRGVPIQTGSNQPDDLLREFIDEVLLKNSPPTFDKMLEEWVYMLACKESIKAQDPLNLPEMEQLIAKLSHTQNPYTCPHGRPTMVTMTRTELEKRFYRT